MGKYASTAVGLVGRDDELMVLRAALEAARLGRPTITLLVGEAGIGKTRLADEAAIMARADGIKVFRGEADHSRREPMEVWRGVYRSLGVDSVRDRSLSVEERRWEHLESLSEAMISCAPALVILEDLHWADPMAIWVLDHLPRELGDVPVALVVTSRDGELDMPRLDGVRRVSRLVQLGGLDVEAVRQLAAAETTETVDAVVLRARTGGNPLLVNELVRTSDGGEVISGVISEILQSSLDRFDVSTRELLAAAAIAGSGTPLALLAIATSCTTSEVSDCLGPALREGVLDEVTPAGVRFHHALLAEAAGRLTDTRALHGRLAAAWDTVAGLDARAAAAGLRLGAALGTAAVALVAEVACEVAGDLLTAGRQERAVGLLHEAHEAGMECVDRPDLRARVALDLAKALREIGDLDPALVLYREAAELARGSSNHVLRARAVLGANLWVDAFVPDPRRVRRLEEVLGSLPPGELHLQAALLGRLTVVGGADPDATDRVRGWADEAVEVARATGDPVLIAQALINQTMSPPSRSELEARIDAADEVVSLAEHEGRSDLALYGHQRRFCHHLNHGDVGAANQALARAELLAQLLPSAGWRQRTLVQRTALLALTGNRSAATASMYEAARVGEGHIEPLILVGCEVMHQLMLLELYGGADPRAEEVYRQAAEMVDDIPSPLLQIQKGFGAQLFGDEARVQGVLHRYAAQPEQILRSMTGDHLLRILGDTVARAGATSFAGSVYRALLPYAGLLNVGGGQCVGLPVDDVLGRLALLRGDAPAALRHARAAVELTRAIPSPPMLVHCLDHLADAVERVGEDANGLRAEADTLAGAASVERSSRDQQSPLTVQNPLRRATMRRDNQLWVLTSPLGEARMLDSNGLGQLARLLTTPGVEVSAIELAGRANTPVATDLGPALDPQAKRAYRQRLLELQAEVDDAEAANDPLRGERAHVEIDTLLRELKRAVGLGGRDRPTGSDGERARVNVVRSLRRAIAAVTEQAPMLGEHLKDSVRTGRHCIYLPEPAVALSWTVETAERRWSPGVSVGR